TKPVRQSDLLNAVQAALAARQPDRAATQHPLRIAPAPRRLRVLLAEDNAVNQKLAVRLLEKRGHAGTAVSNGKDAAAAPAGAGCEAVVREGQRPERGGFEAPAATRARERQTGGHVRVIAMTAHAMKGDRERCLAAGMDGYVSKPIQASELFEAVEGPPAPG